MSVDGAGCIQKKVLAKNDVELILSIYVYLKLSHKKPLSIVIEYNENILEQKLTIQDWTIKIVAIL